MLYESEGGCPLVSVNVRNAEKNEVLGFTLSAIVRNVPLDWA